MKVTTIGQIGGSCSSNDECPPGYYCSTTCLKCHGSCQFCSGGSKNDCKRCSQFSLEWQNELTPPGTTCTCK